MDVGCGSGLFFSKLQLKQSWLWALMFHASCCLKLRSKRRDLRNVFVVQADADHLPFKDGFFGAVFAFTVLQNMPKPAETLGELKRVAK